MVLTGPGLSRFPLVGPVRRSLRGDPDVSGVSWGGLSLWLCGSLPTVGKPTWPLEAGLVTASGGPAEENPNWWRVACLILPTTTMGLASLSGNGTNNDYKRSWREPPVPRVRHEMMLKNQYALRHPSPGFLKFSRYSQPWCATTYHPIGGLAVSKSAGSC